MCIIKNLESVKKNILPTVCLVAVSKTKPQSDILVAYQQGQKVFGENKARELQEKALALPIDISWHFIGHLQTNKVKYIAEHVDVIHSIDSLKILSEINHQAKKHNRIIKCLLQFHIAEEESKFGLNREEAAEILESNKYKEFKNISITGVMGMATYTDDEAQIRKEFRNLKSIFTHIKEKHFPKSECFKDISMGMSGDYKIAMEEGSTMVRVGSLIFGARNYS